jgi:prolyl oligopeptidase
MEFPTTRRDAESGYTLHGRRFDDPYAWLERLDAAETQAWVAALEAVTRDTAAAPRSVRRRRLASPPATRDLTQRVLAADVPPASRPRPRSPTNTANRA